ncbi:MAG TPA: hypothetical protein VK776_04090, partial [Bryobacteraceae bacterium]|nr:hypothetical protein [Bryobacteraceae bacterium]
MSDCSAILSQLAVALVMFGSVSGIAEGGQLQKIWDFAPNTIPALANKTSAVRIYSLAFSRDGKRLAAVIGFSDGDQSLLILDVQTPGIDYLYLPINISIREWEGGDNGIRWSPSGKYVAVGNAVVSLRSGFVCTLPIPGQWTGADRVVLYQRGVRRLSLFDPECRATGLWEELADNQHVSYFVASAERSLLLFSRSTIRDYVEDEVSTSLVDVGSKEVLRRSTWRLTTRRSSQTDGVPFPFQAQFADAAKALCGRRGYWGASVECSSPSTGEIFGVTTGWNAPILRAAVASSRLVISDYSKRYDWIDFRWYPGPLRKRVVWDFRTGKEIVRWKPK